MAVNLSTCLINDIAPLALPIADNRVSSTSQTYARGIAFDIDGQLFSAYPVLNDNNTFVSQSLSCDNATDWACIAELGGVYTPTSGVQTTSDPTAWNGTQDAFLSGDSLDAVFYNDDIRIGPHTLWDVPFYSYEWSETSSSNGSADSAGLSLATNSSFLKSALDNGMMGTKQWSLWPGNMHNNVDGLLVLGGYDEARVDGDFQEFELDPDIMYTYVQITGMEWRNSTTTANLMPRSSTRIWAALEPYYDLITMPRESFDIFTNSSSPGQYNTTMSRYEWWNIPDGDMTITFNNGHKTTIPAEDLFQRPHRYSSTGAIEVTNTTKYIDRISIRADGSNMVLGSPFLTQKILMANWDKGTFSLANAVKKQMSASERKLKSLCTPGPAVNPTIPESSGSSTNVPAIAGGVAGGVGGALIIAIIAFFVLRRRRNKKNATAPAQVSETQQYPASDPPKYPSIGVHETGYAGPPQAGYMAAPIHNNQPIPELYSPRASSPQTVQTSWRDSRADTFHDNQTVVNSVTSGSDRDHYSRSPLDSQMGFGATSGPLELPSSNEMHYHAQR